MGAGHLDNYTVHVCRNLLALVADAENKMTNDNGPMIVGLFHIIVVLQCLTEETSLNFPFRYR